MVQAGLVRQINVIYNRTNFFDGGLKMKLLVAREVAGILRGFYIHCLRMGEERRNSGLQGGWNGDI